MPHSRLNNSPTTPELDKSIYQDSHGRWVGRSIRRYVSPDNATHIAEKMGSIRKEKDFIYIPPILSPQVLGVTIVGAERIPDGINHYSKPCINDLLVQASTLEETALAKIGPFGLFSGRIGMYLLDAEVITEEEFAIEFQALELGITIGDAPVSHNGKIIPHLLLTRKPNPRRAPHIRKMINRLNQKEVMLGETLLLDPYTPLPALNESSV